jgi:hypothetical protein
VGILETLFVWVLGGGFVIGLLGAGLVLVITFVEDVRMLFTGAEENGS